MPYAWDRPPHDDDAEVALLRLVYLGHAQPSEVGLRSEQFSTLLHGRDWRLLQEAERRYGHCNPLTVLDTARDARRVLRVGQPSEVGAEEPSVHPDLIPFYAHRVRETGERRALLQVAQALISALWDPNAPMERARSLHAEMGARLRPLRVAEAVNDGSLAAMLEADAA